MVKAESVWTRETWIREFSVNITLITLSRGALRNDESDEFEVHVLENKPITRENVERFQSETAKDETLGKLIKTIINGWPESKHKLDSDLSPYWNIRDEINISDGLLLKGERIITPL